MRPDRKKRSKLCEDDANLLLSFRLLLCSVLCCGTDREENYSVLERPEISVSF